MCGTRLAANTGRKKSPFWHHRTTLSGCIFVAKACIDNRKKNLLNIDTSSTCPHNTVNFGLLTAEICWRVWGTPANFNGFCLGSVTARNSSSERQPNFAALNRGRHLYLAGRPSGWALAHILVEFQMKPIRIFATQRVFAFSSFRYCYRLHFPGHVGSLFLIQLTSYTAL